jgi:hypothetical protein
VWDVLEALGVPVTLREPEVHNIDNVALITGPDHKIRLILILYHKIVPPIEQVSIDTNRFNVSVNQVARMKRIHALEHLVSKLQH